MAVLSFLILNVLTTGLEPAHPIGHHPLKMACLPIPPRELRQKRVKTIALTLCDLAGARTQDPYIKSVLLYQLSYQVD